uniref:DUF1985 domain-containing protein n=1 Tax=Panagrellus redivivus TaxID=6233 RepID=A0A7E4WC04_PANRE
MASSSSKTEKKSQNMFALAVAFVPKCTHRRRFNLAENFFKNVKAVGEVFLGNVPFDTWTKVDLPESVVKTGYKVHNLFQMMSLGSSDPILDSINLSTLLRLDDDNTMFRMMRFHLRSICNRLESNPRFYLLCLATGLGLMKAKKDLKYLVDCICIALEFHTSRTPHFTDDFPSILDASNAQDDPLKTFKDFDNLIADMTDANADNPDKNLTEEERAINVKKELNKRLIHMDYVDLLDELRILFSRQERADY